MYPGLSVLVASDWTWEPSVLIGVVVVTTAYAWLAGQGRRRFRRSQAMSVWRQMVFHLGTLALFIALTSPIDQAGETKLLSAHMAQHILILFVTAPLWVLGLPGWLVDGLANRMPGLAHAGRWLTQPMVGFVVFNVTLIAWHLPAAYQASLHLIQVHILQHLTFMAAGMIGWWPVLAPDQNSVPRAAKSTQLIYLVLMVFPGLGLAVLLTLSPRVLYPFYQSVASAGVDPLGDQEAAGILMWLTGTVAYLIPLTLVFYSWVHDLERADAVSVDRGGVAERSA
jgi:cytochrome c oxidase assembly factor CtaG